MSTMARYDPDRIAALAAGSLDPAEAAALEAEIAADPRAAAELAAQRLALEALRRAPAPVLSADERTELRRAVAAALHLEDSPQPVATTARRRIPWRPLAVAAAALAALVAAVPLFGLLSVGGEGAPLTTMALEATTAARIEDYATSAGDGMEGLGVAGEQNDATMLGATSPSTTTAPPFATTYTERALADADKAVADLVADPALLYAPAPADDVVPCRDEAVILLEADDPTGRQLLLAEGPLAIWFLSDDGAGVLHLVAFEPDTCRFLAAYP